MNWFDESGFAYPMVEIIPSINRKITGFTLDVLIEMVQVVSWRVFVWIVCIVLCKSGTSP